MGNRYPIRFKMGWGGYVPGNVIFPSASLGSWLEANGYAEKVPDPEPAPVVEEAAVVSQLSPIVEEAPLAKRKRGRPAKRKVTE